jgi:hypothetical protein
MMGELRTKRKRADIGKYSFVNRTIQYGTNYLKLLYRFFPVNQGT